MLYLCGFLVVFFITIIPHISALGQLAVSPQSAVVVLQCMYVAMLDRVGGTGMS